MNLQSFGISNFKAFGQSLQRMPLKPITLIFGPNSAGKSSLLHGLLWTTEAIMQDSFDVRTSKRVSGTLDLGGFLSVLRGHDPANKIKIAVGLDNLPSGEPIQITYEIGIRTEEDAHAIFLRDWIGPDLEIGEFNRQQEVMRETYPLFNGLFNYQNPSTEEVEAALVSEVAWEEQIERHRSYYEELEISSESSFPPLAEAREQYSAAQKAWSLRRELAPSVIPRVQKFWQQFAAEEIKENQGCSVISCDVHFGEKRVMRADRRLGTKLLMIDPQSFDSTAWQMFPNMDHLPNDQRAVETSAGQTTGSLGSIGFSLPPAAEVTVEAAQMMLNHAIPWLVEQQAGLAKFANRLIFVGPLRALPSRRELLGFPNELVTDPLLLPWQRLRDDSSVRDSVNRALKSLTKSELSFRRVAYGEIARVAGIEEDLPVWPQPIDDVWGLPTNWEETRFMEGFVQYPAETLRNNRNDSGPFYKDVKDDDPAAAAQMIEEHLAKRFPHEILFDLLLRDGRSGVDIKPQDVGVGISQIAPVLVQSLGNKNRIIAIEQPEIHIHPKLQAELGDVFIESSLGENKNTFLIETHSEHLILRILRRIRETTRGVLPEGLIGISPEDVAVLFVEPGSDGSNVREIRISPQGRFIDDWPDGFFEERFNEVF